jgi:hypothetical protein
MRILLRGNISCSRVVTEDKIGWSFSSRHPIRLLNFLILRTGTHLQFHPYRARMSQSFWTADKSWFNSLIGQEVLFISKLSRPSIGAHKTFYPMGTGKCSLRHEAAGTSSWPLTSMNGRVKNEWSYICTPPIRPDSLQKPERANRMWLHLAIIDTW